VHFRCGVTGLLRTKAASSQERSTVPPVGQAERPDAREKADRRADVALVTSYHEAQLQELLEHLRDGVRRFEKGELDAFGLDVVVHQYTRAARELWKFCGDRSGASVAFNARVLRQMGEQAENVDWWERRRPQSA
jgi:hypothetical protein